MRVLIVGGGIGGIATAVALHQAGFEPLVLEQARELKEVGAGIVLSSNAMKALAHIGCRDAVARTGLVSQRMEYQDLVTDDRLFASDLSTPQALERFGDAFYHVHRADLMEALLSQIPRSLIRTESRVTAVDQSAGGVHVTLTTGEQVSGDLLVGADGLKSMVRESLLGVQEPRFSGLLTWRAVFPSSRMAHWDRAPVTRIWIGPERYITFYALRGGELLNFVGFVPATEVHRESWTLSGDLHELRESFTGACPRVIEIIESIDQAFISSIVFRDPLPSWRDGRIVLLGDAAHPAPPTAGQGAAMALEDAITLAHCLRGRAQADLGGALEEYELRRRPRATRIQVSARSNDRFMRESDPIQVRARNGRFRGIQQLDPCGEVLWRAIYGFDPVKALQHPLKDLLARSTETANPRIRAEARRAFDLWRMALGPEDHARGWRGQREGYERFLQRICPMNPNLHVDEVHAGGVASVRILRRGSPPGGLTLLHLHGGGYVLGSAKSAAPFAARLADAICAQAVIPDYRLAPEHPYPAALEDCLSAFRALAGECGAENIIVSGEDAGGGLALALTHTLVTHGEPAPRGLYLVSPFCDLSLRAASIDASQGRDAWLNRDFLTFLAASYMQSADPRDAALSPVFANLAGFPPMLIHVAADEALLDDARTLADTGADIDVGVHQIEDSVHSFMLFDFLPESVAGLAELAEWSRRLRGRER